MNWLKQAQLRRQMYRDLKEELALHLQEKTEDLISKGLSRGRAERRAKREFGNVRRIEERSREVWQVEFFETFWLDCLHYIRRLYKIPGFAATAILTLALGMGASVAIFAFVDAALIKPLPYANPERLVHVTESDAALPRVNLSYLDYMDWKRMNTVVSSLEAFSPGWNLLLSTASGTEPLAGERVSAGFFRTLGVVPVLGRDFHPGEDEAGHAPVVMITYGTWQGRFNGKKDIIGQSVDLNSVAYTIIGVLPREFAFAPGRDAEFWAALQPDNDCDRMRDCHNYFAIGRLRDGVSVKLALANMQTIAHQLEVEYPDSNRGRGASVMRLSERIIGDIRPTLLLLLGGAGLLLLIAFANVSSLLVVQSENRRREVGIRQALGASRVRIVHQFATEAIVLVSLGSAAGLAFAYGVMKVLRRLISRQMMVNMPYLQGLGFHVHVAEFTALLALIAWLLFTLVPTMHLLSFTLRDGLTEGGRIVPRMQWRWMGRRMVVIELVVTMVLLTGAGLLGKSVYRLLHVDVGFQTDHLATLHVRLPISEFPGDLQQVDFSRRLLNRVESLPGVQAAGLSTLLPVSCNCYTDWIRVVGRPYKGIHLTVNVREVSPGFFSMLHTKLLAGRYFGEADDVSKPKVMVVNRAFAQKYFPTEDSVGKLIGDPTLSLESMRRVIGVVENFKDASLDEAQEPAAYYSFNQYPKSDFFLLVRSLQDERAALPSIASAINQLNHSVGVDQQISMTDHISDSKTAYFHRSAAYLISGFAVVALVLSVVGVYGVLAFSINRRTREIGVRIALRTRRGSVYRMVLQEAGWLAVMGILGGAACSMLVGSFLRGLLFGVHPWDLSVLAFVSIMLGFVALSAGYVPAHRAAR
jgi:macrolide transport system ATP-binding/permease protein